MMGRRFIVLFLAALLIGATVLVSLSEVKYRVGLTSVVELWGDVLRDADNVGLTITRVSDQKEMTLGAQLGKRLESLVVADPTLQQYVSEVGQRLAGRVRRKNIVCIDFT